MKRPDTKAIRARADAATPGEWLAWREARAKSNPFRINATNRGIIANQIVGGGTNDDGQANAEFIVAARTDVPALCDRVEALEAALRRLVPVLDSCVTAACAKVPPDYAETVDALDEVRAALEGTND